MRVLQMILWAASYMLLQAVSNLAQDRPKFRPVPPGVVELTSYGRDGGIVELKDGSLMMAQGGGINDQSTTKPRYRISNDRGKT